MAGEIGMKALVAGDEFVGEGESGHERAFFEPKDGAEGPREENSLDGCEGDQSLLEGAVAIHPLHGPLRLLADHIDVLDGREEIVLLGQIFDVGVDQQRVGLRVDVLHRDLEPIEAPRLGNLHL